MARDPMLGSSETMSTSIQKLNSHLGLVFDEGADVKKEDRVVTGAAIMQESRGMEKRRGERCSPRCRKNVKLSFH